jgi:hypothetical protein
MFVSCECFVLSYLCDGPIPRPEESYRLRRVIVCVIYKHRVWGGPGPRWAVAP